jgi:hypothetical protein
MDRGSVEESRTAALMVVLASCDGCQRWWPLVMLDNAMRSLLEGGLSMRADLAVFRDVRARAYREPLCDITCSSCDSSQLQDGDSSRNPFNAASSKAMSSISAATATLGACQTWQREE